MQYLSNQRTEYACQDRRICTFVNRVCRRETVRRSSLHAMAKVLMDHPFNVYRLPDQLYSDNEREFVNNLWRELFSEFKIHHTTTPPYNPSSNLVEGFHRTLTAMLRTQGPGVKESWDLWLNGPVFATTLQ